MAPAPPEFLAETVDVQDRVFEIRVFGFENGRFVSVTEGGMRMGSMMASVASGQGPAVTTTVIPARAGDHSSPSSSSFVRLVAEKVSATIRGIAVVSVNVRGGGEIDTAAAKAIMGRIAEMIRNV